MLTGRGSHTALPALLVIVLASGVSSQSAPPAPADDRARCEAGAIDACVRVDSANCDAGQAKACTALTRRYFVGVGVPRDRDRADRMMTRAAHLADSACTTGDLGGCAIAAQAFGLGQGVSPNPGHGRALAERACTGGNADGCFVVGFASLTGMMGFTRDSARATQLLESTCAGGHSNACFQLGWNYEYGRTVARDPARAAVFYNEGCDNAVDADDMLACHFLGSAYAEGRGVATDVGRATQLYQRACRRGNGSACNNLGSFLQEGQVGPKDPNGAAGLYDRACQLGNPTGCNNLGIMYARGNGVARDETRAKALWKQACELGFRPACDYR